MRVPDAPGHVLVQLDHAPPAAAAPAEVRLFAKCRNEMLRLPAFLRHYRQLSVDRFFIVDNGSTDGTEDYLLAQPDVHVFRTENRFAEARSGTAWLNALLGEFGVGRWCVTVDVDELMVFPGSERTGLRPLVRYLDRASKQALFCLLLDLYPAGPVRECAYVSGGDLLASAPCFDPAPYVRKPTAFCPGVAVLGGVRERVFYPEVRRRSPARRMREALYRRLARRLPGAERAIPRWRPRHAPGLTKVPLVKWDERTRYLDVNHYVSARAVAEETGVLLHFKFLQDLPEKAVAEAARREYYDGASEYRRYARLLARHPDLSLADEHSARYRDSAQLVELGLARDTPAWRDWCCR